MLKNKKYLFGLSMAFLCYLLQRGYWYGINGTTMYQYITLIFGTVSLGDEKNMMWNMALWLVPQIVILIYYADFFEKNIVANQSLLFSRTNKRKTILIQYSLKLGIRVVLMVLLELGMATIVGIIFGVSFEQMGIKFWIEVFNIIGAMSFIIIMLNLLSLFMNPLYGIIFVLFFEWVQIFLIQKHRVLGKYLPVAGILQEIRIESSKVQAGKMGLCLILFIVGVEVIAIWSYQKKKDVLTS